MFNATHYTELSSHVCLVLIYYPNYLTEHCAQKDILEGAGSSFLDWYPLLECQFVWTIRIHLKLKYIIYMKTKRIALDLWDMTYFILI